MQMKPKKLPKVNTKGLTPNKGKRRTDGWDPSPVKGKFSINKPLNKGK